MSSYNYGVYFLYKAKNPEHKKLLDAIEELQKNESSSIVLILSDAFGYTCDECYDKLYDVYDKLRDVIGWEEARNRCLLTTELCLYIMNRRKK